MNLHSVNICITKIELETSDSGKAENFAVATGLHWSTVLWAFVNVVLFICILSGNVLVIIAVRSCRRLRSLLSNRFILSLAVADVVVGLTLPYHLSFYLGLDLGIHHNYCLMRFFLVIFACCVSILTLITISVDRYIAIIYALHYKRFMTPRIVLSVIVCNWIMGAFVAIIPMFCNHWKTARECEFDEVLPPWYMTGFIFPSFIVIWLLMVLMYMRILRVASKQAKQVRQLPRSMNPSILLSSDWRSTQIVFFIMGCFSLCWLPYFIVVCAQIFNIFNVEPLLYRAAFSLAMTNSALNPIIYCWKNKSFRRAFNLLLRCRSPNVHPTSLIVSFSNSTATHKRNSLSCANDTIEMPIVACAKNDRLPKIYTIKF
ncbi:adenosine receptor A3 [Glossina fuscipes]|uniref:Adenosine receptor A3 n=1 Tax=Glossina fuscipes TaxID=7396 RepID=A0A9C5YXY1_9MUSC|nr:adenosine receptor A3 [Glossina fuscipes]